MWRRCEDCDDRFPNKGVRRKYCDDCQDTRQGLRTSAERKRVAEARAIRKKEKAKEDRRILKLMRAKKLAVRGLRKNKK